MAAAALLLAACGSDAGTAETVAVTTSPPTVVTTGTPPTAGASTTTVAPPTTEAASTTSAVSAPWTTLPEYPPPETPLLLTPSGEPEAIRDLCVEVSTEGVARVDPDSTSLTRALEILGVEVVTADCRAELRISAAASRYSAAYGGVGECWTGHSFTMETVLGVDGATQEAWAVDEDSPPPDRILESMCSKQDSPVVPGRDAFVAPFVDMWGEVGYFAIGAARPGVRPPDGVEFTDEVVWLIAARLVAEPTSGTFNGSPIWKVLDNWTGYLGRDDLDRLRPLTPILVMLLDRPDGDAEIYGFEGDSSSYGGNSRQAVESALENITGQTFDTPAQWWGWWEDQLG